MNKRGFEFSFGWIFAIIVGAVFIVLAVYGASKFVGTERYGRDSEVAAQLSLLMNPIETGVEESKSTMINLAGETRIYNTCSKSGNFGTQKIAVATKAGIGGEWLPPGANSTTYSKYVFSKSVIQGSKVNAFSKSFEMPFKIADLIFIWSENDRYCFIDPPRYIEEELDALFLSSNRTNTIALASSASSCPKESTTICFASSNCNVEINEQSNSVKKKGQTVYYYGPLMYGAIFADPAIYQCQVERLMKRASELSLLYLKKSEYISTLNSGCSSNMQGSLLSYSNQTLRTTALDVDKLKFSSDGLRRLNDALVSCKIF